MVYQTEHYKLTIFNNCFTVKAFNIPETEIGIKYGVYNEYDNNFSEPILEAIITNQTQRTDCLSKDGKYKILIEAVSIDDDCLELASSNRYIFRDIYEFQFYITFENNFLIESQELICDCKVCKDLKLADCNFCSNDNELKNTFNSIIFLLFYTLFYNTNLNIKLYHDYLKLIFDRYDIRISNRFYKMFKIGKVKGIYELDFENMYILLVATYIYFYLIDLHNSDMNTIIKNKYDIETVKDCIFNNGLEFDTFEQFFFETNLFGDIITIQEDCDGDNLCTEIIEQDIDYDNLKYSKVDFKTNITFSIDNNNMKVMFMIPKIWGKPFDILDLSGSSILHNFVIFDYKNYYIYFSKVNYSNGVYTIKFIYNE